VSSIHVLSPSYRTRSTSAGNRATVFELDAAAPSLDVVLAHLSGELHDVAFRHGRRADEAARSRKSPSFVARSTPARREIESPIGNARTPSVASMSPTEGRPSGSWSVATTPRGL